MNEAVLTIQEMTKRYGRICAIDKLSLEIERGTIHGILGPNGSGKTTTLGAVLDVTKTDSGSYRWFGQTPSHHLRKRIGSLLEHPLFYPYLNAERNLKLVAQIKEKPVSDIDRVLKLVDLYDRRMDKFRTYSYGMKQRLAIAAAMLGNPDVLILDEPTNGLDPKGIAEIRELIIRIGSEGNTIILASHMLDEVQKMCSHVAVLHKGRKLFNGNVEQVLNEHTTLELSSEENTKLFDALSGMKLVNDIQKNEHLIYVSINCDATPAMLNRQLFEMGITLDHLAVKKQSLEKYFLELLEADNHDTTPENRA